MFKLELIARRVIYSRRCLIFVVFMCVPAAAH